ncbi:MAG: VOC family protein, partial [Pseudomonadota bacterium]
MMSELTPELYVTNLNESLAFYCGLLGFEIEYERPEDSFAFLKLGAVSLMLEEPVGRTWITATLEPPFGRGVNFQIMVENVEKVYAKCLQSEAKILVPLEHRSYR